MSMQQLDAREEVWAIIDRHREQASAESSESTRMWRLALHRMDVRGLELQSALTGAKEAEAGGGEDTGQRVYLGTGKMDSDVQEMVDNWSESAERSNRHLELWNLAQRMWNKGRVRRQNELANISADRGAGGCRTGRDRRALSQRTGIRCRSVHSRPPDRA